jgi:hypothetical protein
LPVDVFLDNNPAKADVIFHGKRVVQPKDYPNLNELYIIVIVGLYKEIEEQLKDLGLTKYDDYINYLELL